MVAPTHSSSMSSTWTVVDVNCAQGRMLSVMGRSPTIRLPGMGGIKALPPEHSELSWQ